MFHGYGNAPWQKEIYFGRHVKLEPPPPVGSYKSMIFLKNCPKTIPCPQARRWLKVKIMFRK